MIRALLFSLALISSSAEAAPCRDARGRFITCPTPPPAPAGVLTVGGRATAPSTCQPWGKSPAANPSTIYTVNSFGWSSGNAETRAISRIVVLQSGLTYIYLYADCVKPA